MFDLICGEIAAVDDESPDHAGGRTSALFRNVDMSVVVQIPRV